MEQQIFLYVAICQVDIENVIVKEVERKDCIIIIIIMPSTHNYYGGSSFQRELWSFLTNKQDRTLKYETVRLGNLR